ncbi:aldehyde dehydrogenase family protein, partial [Deinococcus sp.]|uniref:aldehyde dehydrogenase family protein n=1 Tax=Deinococcus sp. TaxID=47478 RepID=UPI0038D4EAC9
MPGDVTQGRVLAFAGRGRLHPLGRQIGTRQDGPPAGWAGLVYRADDSAHLRAAQEVREPPNRAEVARTTTPATLGAGPRRSSVCNGRLKGQHTRPERTRSRTEVMKSINPATGETIASYDDHTPAQVQDGIGTAHEAFGTYRRTTFAQRAAWMNAAADVL